MQQFIAFLLIHTSFEIDKYQKATEYYVNESHFLHVHVFPRNLNIRLVLSLECGSPHGKS